jgi:hypothetical protein
VTKYGAQHAKEWGSWHALELTRGEQQQYAALCSMSLTTKTLSVSIQRVLISWTSRYGAPFMAQPTISALCSVVDSFNCIPVTLNSSLRRTPYQRCQNCSIQCEIPATTLRKTLNGKTRLLKISTMRKRF